MNLLPSMIGIALTSTLLIAGCGGGYSTQEANKICKEDQSEGTLDEEVLKQCVTCFETCTECARQGTTPETYACPLEE